MNHSIFGGINRHKLDEIFRSLGGNIYHVPGTGDIVYMHPLFGRSSRANGRRKDAPRHLVAFVHRIERGL
jgi:hypothetical protein